MKQIENNFAVSGFVGKDAEIRQFANASVARFSLAVSRQEKNGEETKRVSAFINVEAWRSNTSTAHPDNQGRSADRGGLLQTRRVDRQRRRKT